MNEQEEEKPLSEIEFLEYMSNKAKSINTIVYPDGTKGELDKSVIVIL